MKESTSRRYYSAMRSRGRRAFEHRKARGPRRGRPSRHWALLLLLVAAFATSELPTSAADELPPGVEQILPRGQIPAVFEPRFVSADEAEIPDDAWVLGVVVDGVAKAYSLNLLNRHEVVNDRSGGTDFAAVW